MSKQFPLCKCDDDNPALCLECKLPSCVHDTEDKWRAVLARQRKAEDQKRKAEEEAKVIEELLELKWIQYQRFHPKGMGEREYKTRQRSNLAYQMRKSGRIT